MSKEAALLKKVGGNMLESIGVVRHGVSQGVPTGPDRPPTIPMADARDGRTRNHTAGYMRMDNIITDDNQVRLHFSEEGIRNLADSFHRFGQLQPVELRWDAERGKHVVVNGERRYRAARLLGWETISCTFLDKTLTQSEKKKRQLTENCLREDLKPHEQAEAFRELMELEGWNAQQLAEALCLSKGLVSQRLALFDLPEELQKRVADDKLTGDEAYSLTRIKDAEVQRELADRIETEGLNRDAVRQIVREKTGKAKSKSGRPVTTRTVKVSNATVSVKFNKKRVATADVIAALEEALEQLGATRDQQ